MARTATAKRGEQVARRAVGYVRVSTDEQANGPEAQRAALSAWAQREGVQLVAVYEDLGISGAAALDERPGLLAALDAVADGADLLVAKRDRLARDSMLAAMVDRLVEREGRRVLTADGAGNGDGPEAVMLRSILDVFAQYERAMIRTRTRAALAAKRARGERVGNVPFGYVAGPDGRLVPDPSEQAVIAAARDMRAAGWTLRAIVAELERVGTVGRTGRALGLTQVARLLSDRAAA